MKIQLAVCAQDLPTAGAYFAEIIVADLVVGRTETVTDTTSPHWQQLVTPGQDLEEDSQLTVQVHAGG